MVFLSYLDWLPIQFVIWYAWTTNAVADRETLYHPGPTTVDTTPPPQPNPEFGYPLGGFSSADRRTWPRVTFLSLEPRARMSSASSVIQQRLHAVSATGHRTTLWHSSETASRQSHPTHHHPDWMNLLVRRAPARIGSMHRTRTWPSCDTEAQSERTMRRRWIGLLWVFLPR
ncbi:hypothetical protein SAMD00023353_0103550 [Rosellinia necatrix]|uniref:Secreted protein n=1 Tax=Rosellinia necatrix TaxID=77044 RepID=A0A1S8A524_ROSNE|nr:hypothetical protein SAMD00023353_0103550 [Rosellinia necatrix]